MVSFLQSPRRFDATTFGLVALALASYSAFARHEPRSEMPESIELGHLQNGTSVDVVIPVKNVGNAPLLVEEVVAGCSCLKAERPEGEFAPGETAQIKIRYHVSAFPGTTVERPIQIRTNETGKLWQRVLIHGRMANFLAATPGRLAVQLRTGDSFEREIQVQATDVGEAFQIRSVTSDVDGLEIEAPSDKLAASRESSFIVRQREVKQAGHFEGKLHVATTSKSTPELIVPVSIQVAPRVSVDPPLLVFRSTDGAMAPAKVSVKAVLPVSLKPTDTDLVLRSLSEGNEPSENWVYECLPAAGSKPGTQGVLRFAVEGDPYTQTIELRYIVVNR